MHWQSVFNHDYGKCILMVLALQNLSCKSFGSNPGEDLASKFSKAIAFNQDKGVFENRRPDLIAKMRKKMKSWDLFKQWWNADKNVVPAEKLPELTPDLNMFSKASEALKMIWLGHSSFLINLNGFHILIDPVFSDAASPFSFIVKRFQKPVLELTELPEIDFIVISHDHYDHLDMKTIEFFVDKDVKFIVPLGVGSHLQYWGVKANQILEHDWWQTTTLGEIEFTATPAQHFSGRKGFDGDKTLWASWVIKSKQKTLYFSGDTGYDSHFKKIGEKYGPIDIALIESGQYNERWREVHMLPEESIKAYHDLNAKRFFPIHWGMFQLSIHPWFEPIEILYQAYKENEINLIAPRLGEVFDANGNYKLEPWWEEVAR